MHIIKVSFIYRYGICTQFLIQTKYSSIYRQIGQICLIEMWTKRDILALVVAGANLGGQCQSNKADLENKVTCIYVVWAVYYWNWKINITNAIY